MVLSKRCKVCCSNEGEHLPISGVYFGKLIPELVFNVSGVELDPRKLSGVLICHACAVQLVHTECVISRIRKTMLRLKKPMRGRKLPSKEAIEENVAPTPKTKTQKKNNSAKMTEYCEGSREHKETNILNGKKPELEKKSVKRKINLLKSEEATAFASLAIPTETVQRKLDIFNHRDKDSTILEDEVASVPKKKKRSKNPDESGLLELTTDDLDITQTNVEQNIKKSKSQELNCVLCEKIFYEKSFLREHIETSHMGETLKECPNCSAEFRSIQKYESHVFSQKCKTTLHPCQFENCHKKFKTVYKMEVHMREKHLCQNEIEED